MCVNASALGLRERGAGARGYFPGRYHLDTSRAFVPHYTHVLQYAFKNGFEMGKVKSEPGVSAKGKERADD